MMRATLGGARPLFLKDPPQLSARFYYAGTGAGGTLFRAASESFASVPMHEAALAAPSPGMRQLAGSGAQRRGGESPVPKHEAIGWHYPKCVSALQRNGKRKYPSSNTFRTTLSLLICPTVQIASKQERPRASAAHSPVRTQGMHPESGAKSKRSLPLSRANRTAPSKSEPCRYGLTILLGDAVLITR